MIICPNCQKQLPDGASFCDGCGTQFQQAVICPKCGNQTPANLGYCQACGVQFAAPSAPAAPAAKGGFDFNAILGKIKALPKKTLGLIGGGIVAVIAIIVIIAIIAGSAMPSYVLYQKGGDLFYRDLSKKTSVEFEDAYNAVLSTDGKTLFIKNNDGDLVYAKANDKKAETKKWISLDGVSDYLISENGKKITYINDGDLCQKKLGAESATKITSDVYSFTATSNGSKILYANKDAEVFYLSKIKNGEKGVKLASDVKSVRYISEDLKTIIFADTEGDLYIATVKGKDSKKTKIAEDANLVAAFDTKNIYYTTTEEIKENELTKTETSLFFYNGKESKELAKGNYYYASAGSKESKSLVYLTRDEDKESYTVKYFVAVKDATNELHSYTHKYEENAKNNYTTLSDIAISENGKTLYYIEKENKTYKPDEEQKPAVGELKTVKISKKLGTPKVYASDVYSLDYAATYYTGKVVYTKDYKKDKGTYDLYLNKKMICSGVEDHDYHKEAKGFAIFVDDSFKFYKSKLVTVADSTKKMNDNYDVLPSGEIVFINDVKASGKGTLYVFNGKKSKEIDTGVTSITGMISLDKLYEDGANLSLSIPEKVVAVPNGGYAVDEH